MRRVGSLLLVASLIATGCGDDTTTVVQPNDDGGRLTLSVELEQTEVAAGTPIAGVLVFENSGDALSLMSSECAPLWGIGLAGDDVEPQVDFTVPCLTSLSIPPGRSEQKFVIQTRLPPGEYHTELVMFDGDRDLGAPPPAPVTVTLTD